MTPAAVREMGLRLVEEEMSARRFAEGSKRAVRIALRDFYRWVQKRKKGDLGSYGKRDFLRYLSVLSSQASKRTGEALVPSTINQRLSSVYLLYSCLYRSGVIAENPTHGLDLRVPEPRAWRRRPLTREEITKFLETIDLETPTGLRDRTLFELLYSSGLRVGEAASLRVKDIDFERRLMIVRGKFDRDRMVPISEVAHDFLVHYLGTRIDNPEAWIFPGRDGRLAQTTISERFRELLRRFDMDRPEISTHSIRHSTATHLLENGASVRHVQELLGHRDIESTVRYTQVMTDGLAKVYHAHHPREHELLAEVDEDYRRRLAATLKPTDCGRQPGTVESGRGRDEEAWRSEFPDGPSVPQR